MINEIEKFEIKTIHRSLLKNAPYNPRKISKRAQNKLKKILKQHGLVSPIIWNERTGNIVGGHQKIEIIDSLSKSNDYELTVSVLNVDEREEVKININLNQSGAQGEFDSELLKCVSDDFDIDLISDLNFDKIELEYNFGIYIEDENSDFSNNIEEALEELNKNKDAAKEQKKKQREEIKEQRDNGNHELSSDTRDYDIIVIFDSNKQKKEFLKSIGKEENVKYIHIKEIK